MWNWADMNKQQMGDKCAILFFSCTDLWGSKLSKIIGLVMIICLALVWWNLFAFHSEIIQIRLWEHSLHWRSEFTSRDVLLLFSRPGRSIPTLGRHSPSLKNLDTKKWLLRLETLQTFDQSDVWTKRQKDKKTKWQNDKITKDKNMKRQKYKKKT